MNSETNTENKVARSAITAGVILLTSVALTACVVAPSQPIGYRETSSVLPTYVNGQYVGMQPSGYAPPAQESYPVPTPSDAHAAMAPSSAYSTSSWANQSTNQSTYQPPTVVQQVPVYTQPSASSVVYVQNPAPIYSYPYNPYYYPTYVDPWYGPGAGVAVGLGIGIGFGSYHGCCWRGRGGWGRGWRH